MTGWVKCSNPGSSVGTRPGSGRRARSLREPEGSEIRIGSRSRGAGDRGRKKMDVVGLSVSIRWPGSGWSQSNGDDTARSGGTEVSCLRALRGAICLRRGPVLVCSATTHCGSV